MTSWKIAAAWWAAAPLFAQWINYPTPGIPRLPDGKPNLSAPAPRTADGHPESCWESGNWSLHLARPTRSPLAAEIIVGDANSETSACAFRMVCRISHGPPSW